MAENVFILGAGFSYDAGVPLMSSFVERMWEIAKRKKHPLDGEPLNGDDQELLDNALGLIADLDGYHGRANFDDRNIEDLLSILSFKQLAGGKGRASLGIMTRAIARTIELTCSIRDRNLVAHPLGATQWQQSPYDGFWLSLFKLHALGKAMPTIITFNYDLVLERSLVGVLTGNIFSPKLSDDRPLPLGSFAVNYFKPNTKATAFQVAPMDFPLNKSSRGSYEGYKLLPYDDPDGVQVEFKLLKLHGSLNFRKSSKDSVQLEAAVDDPQILPPLFNKDTAALGSPMWAQALRELSDAKNVVVVGYSLPQTDIYMQYFLRSALGPNLELNKITVFDPSLFDTGASGANLMRRYQDCFSPQLQPRIKFQPSAEGLTRSGSTQHFLRVLEHNPSSILFL